MAGHNPIQVQGYGIDDAAGVGAAICVVFGAADGGCKKPAAANAAAFLGVTVEAQTVQNKNVPVARLGTVAVLYGGTIARGDRLVINGATGSVKSAEAVITAAPGTPSVQNVVGIAEVSGVAGDIGFMNIQAFVVNIATS